jgi:KaiC/GvpD/RAD55 family RecA-like ATPase/DNA-binding response OmpR family regulator
MGTAPPDAVGLPPAGQPEARPIGIAMTTEPARPPSPPKAPPLVDPTLSTGIPGLDERLGGLARGGYYLLTGAEGSGRTSVALHFLAAGLARGERCAMLTGDDPAALAATADHLGINLRGHVASGRLVLLRYQRRLTWSAAQTTTQDADHALEEVERVLSEAGTPSRLVVDGFADGADDPAAALRFASGAARLLSETGGITYVVAPGTGDADDEGPEAELRRDAACILRLEREAQNRFLLRTEDHTGPEPHEEGWVFQVREGVGIVERPGITAAPRRVTFVGTGELPPRLLDALMRDYEIAPDDVLDALPAEIVDQRYGVIIVGVESRRPRPGIELIRRLRENGVTAGIVLHAAAENFRRAARAEAIRAGVDDIVMDDFSREEYLERVERARSRDRTSPPRPQEGYEPVYQPVGRDGEPELMAEEAMRNVVRNRVTTLPDAHFAVVRLRPVHITTKEAWDVLVRQLRLSNGDLIAQTSDALVIYLHDVELDDLHDILERLGASHPGLGGSAAVSIAWHPADTEYLTEWAGRGATAIEEPGR